MRSKGLGLGLNAAPGGKTEASPTPHFWWHSNWRWHIRASCTSIQTMGKRQGECCQSPRSGVPHSGSRQMPGFLSVPVLLLFSTKHQEPHCSTEAGPKQPREKHHKDADSSTCTTGSVSCRERTKTLPSYHLSLANCLCCITERTCLQSKCCQSI